jgi:two-component system chemotaxis response regulator CheB
MVSSTSYPGHLAPPQPSVVVIGVSAGAVAALGEILPPLPSDFPWPIIVVVHVGPGRRSRMCDLFSERCALATREPCDSEPIGRGTIWFALADYHLLVESDRTFALSIEAPVHHSRPSIDVLFESAARAYRGELMAIVLTCASSDGLVGAELVRELGGFVLAQDPGSAEAPYLPALVAARGVAHRIGTLSEISKLLLEAAARGDGS